MTLSASQSGAVLDDDGIALYDLLQILVDGWGWIVGAVVAGLIAATAFLVVTPPQYEAVALVQVGQVGQVAQIGQVGQVGPVGQIGMVPVESLARVVERVAFPTFKDAMLKKLGWADGDVRRGVYLGSINAKVVRGTDLIEVKVRGLTREDARTSLDATIEHLASLHKMVAQPVIEDLQADLLKISAEVKETEKTLVALERSARLQAQVAPRERFSESMLYMQLATSKENHLRELKRREIQYRELTSLTGKSVTAAFAEPSVSGPVSPRNAQTLLLAILGGLFLGVAAVMLRRGWQNWSRRSQPVLPT